MLTGTVDTGKGLFVEKANQIVFCCTLFHDFHNQLVAVTGTVGIGVDGRQFMLTGCRFVVLGFRENSKTPQLLVQILHVSGNTGTDGAKVMIVKFLALRGLCTEECTAGQTEVFSFCIQIFGKNKILLLSTDTDLNTFGFVVAKQP